MTFYKWIVENYYNATGPIADLARDMATDEYVGKNTYNAILGHLLACHACPSCLETFQEAWQRYQADPNKAKKTSLKKRRLQSAKPIIGCWSDSKDSFFDLSRDHQQLLLQWIANKLRLSSTFNPYHTSYGLKHIFARDAGVYISNAQFKDAMILAGFTPKCACERNHHYRISEYSKAFQPKNCLETTHFLPTI